MSSAVAEPSPKITICHRTGSKSNPYVKITISENAWHAHERHPAKNGRVDFKLSSPADSCTTTPPPPPPPSVNDDGSDCDASSGPGDSTQSLHGLVNVGNVNVDLNLLATGFCHSNVGNGLTVAGIGEALAGGVGSASGDGDCDAGLSVDSDQDQDGAVNVGNINLDGNNLLANAFCEAHVLDGLTVSLIVSAVGDSSLGSGLLTGGALGLLSGAPGYLLSGLTTDVRVLANVLVQF